MKIVFTAIMFCAIGIGVCTTVFAQSREYKIKAEFLERFTRFIEWPDTAPAKSPSTTFHICVIGQNPFGRYLADLTGEIKIQNKDVEVSNITGPARIDGCELLFIDKSEASNLAAILSVTANKPILTVADTVGFAEKGVLINFYTAGDFIHFEINQAAAHKSRLRFSSRLLKLGRLVN